MTSSTIWADGVTWLAGGDDAKALASARGYVGRLVKTYGLAAVSDAIRAGLAVGPAKPRAWLYVALVRRAEPVGAAQARDQRARVLL